MEEKEHIVQATPKAVTFRKGFVLSLAIFVVILFFLLVYMMVAYNPQHLAAEKKNDHSIVADKDAGNGVPTDQIVDDLASHQSAPLIVGQEKTATQKSHKASLNAIAKPAGMLDQQTDVIDGMTEEQFKEANESPITVLGGDTQSDMGSHYPAEHSASNDDSAGMGQGGTNAGRDAYASQNMQSEKVAFLAGAGQQSDLMSTHLKAPISPYEIMAGTIIPAILKTSINSDLPGTVLAQVSENVYDTPTGNYLLIPQGTKLVGVYDSQVAYGQDRVLLVWTRLIFPNGESFDLDNQPGADLTGAAGLSDQVNNHYARIFSSALLFSLLGAAGQLSQPQTSGNTLSNQQIIYGAIGQQLSQTGMQMVAKQMNIQPTITIRAGDPFNVLLTRDMVFPHTF